MTSNPGSANIVTPDRVVILGAGGQVGQEFQYLISTGQWPQQFTFLSHNDVDITHADQLQFYLEQLKAQVVINCAAYTQVDRAESDCEQAYAVNVRGVENLAQACRKMGAFLIHFSSDYVYHNNVNRPLLETDATDPKGYYGKTKLWGEEKARAVLPGTMIVRTSWVYSAFGNNFVKTMLRLGKEKSEVSVVDDQLGTPTWARDLATAVLQIISTRSPDTWAGIYNYSNEGVASWYDFAHSIFRLTGYLTPIYPIPSLRYPTPAPRPNYSILSKQKIKEGFNLTIPHWTDSLASCLREIQP